MLLTKQQLRARCSAWTPARQCATRSTALQRGTAGSGVPAGFLHQAGHQSAAIVCAAQVQETVQEEIQTKTGIRELTKDDFYQALEEAQDTLVVVDFYTDWCGPCKVIYPELVKMAEAYDGRVIFTKLNCNKTNKELGVKLAIKVAPTFHLYKRSEKVAEMTGAKVDKLKALIESNL